MYLKDKEFPTATLQEMVTEPPITDSAIEAFIQVYKVSKGFLNKAVFSKIRERIESAIDSSLNLRKTLDKATFGRFIIWGELSHRQALPQGWQHLNLLMDDEPYIEQLVIPFEEYQEQPRQPATPDPEPEPQSIGEVEEETIREQRDRYYQQLKEFEEFTQFLLLGKIFPAPITTNGLEKAPLLKVFGGAQSLQTLHYAYQKLLKLWHPDLCSQAPKEAQERFDFLRKAYATIVNNWSSFNPQNLDIPQSRIDKLMAQELKWKPESWWY